MIISRICNKNNSKYLLLLVWGILCAYALIHPYLFSVGNGWIAGFRADRLTWRYEYLITKGKVPFGVKGLGAYGIYFPYIMKFFHITDGMTMFCFMQAICGGIVIILYPLLTYMYFHSLEVAIVSPIILHLSVGDMLYINKSGEYYAGLWVLAAGLPLILLLINETKKKRIVIYVILIALEIALSNIVRAQSGIAVLLGCILILIWKKRKCFIKMSETILLIVALLICNNLLASTLPNTVAKMRGVTEKHIAYPGHALLIGLGYIENDYGLAYDDSVAEKLIKEKYPDVVYNSPEYFQCCMDVYLEILKENPAFVIRCHIVKFLDGIRLQLLYISDLLGICLYSKPLILILCVIILSSIGIMRRQFNQYKDLWQIFFVGTGISVISLTQSLIAIPTEYYCWGAIGGMGVTITYLALTCVHLFFRDYISDN